MMNLIKGKSAPKPINTIPKQVYDAFEKASPKFLVCGVRRNGEQYSFASFHCPTREHLLENLSQDSLVRHIVFEVSEVPYGVEALLKKEAKEYMEKKTKDERYQLYLTLNKEFGKKPEPEPVLE